MVKRYPVELNNSQLIAGLTGKFLTLNVVPVIAGDSIEGHFSGVMRLTAARRNVIFDTKVDIVTFFEPHRHIYPNWLDYIKAGITGGVTLATTTYGDIGKETKNPDGSPSGNFILPYYCPWGEILQPGATAYPS